MEKLSVSVLWQAPVETGLLFVVIARPAHFVRGSSRGVLFPPQFSGE